MKKTLRDIHDQYIGRINEAALMIRQHSDVTPEVALVLGSGLSDLAEQVENADVLPYQSLPGFLSPSVKGHEGRLVLGSWSGLRVAVLQGRFHYYEGYDMQDVVFPIRVLQRLGVPRLILTNAAGGINRAMKPGELMLINDHIGLFAESPLRGLNLDEFGPRFPDQSVVYDASWRALALECANKFSIPLHSGVYAWCRGPQFETPAEIRALEKLGADAVGMSTVPEAITAVHGGMKVLALSCISNMAAGILNQPLSHEEVMRVGKQASASIILLLSAILSEMKEVS